MLHLCNRYGGGQGPRQIRRHTRGRSSGPGFTVVADIADAERSPRALAQFATGKALQLQTMPTDVPFTR